VYAIGATAVAMLTGREPEDLPHRGLAVDVRAALRGHASEPLVEVLEQMLDPDPDRRASRIAPLLAALDADVAISAAFPMLIPADALDVLPLGIVNTHPSLLPRYRGPNPIAWTVRNGDHELGYSVHRMDADFDSGPLLAQGTTPIDDVEDSSEVFERMFALLGSLLPAALLRVENGDPGDPQPGGQATYAGFFEPEYVEIDWSQTAAEVRRQVLAWSVAAARPGARGALTTLGGERVRVLRVRFDDAEGGTRVDCADAALWIVETEPA